MCLPFCEATADLVSVNDKEGDLESSAVLVTPTLDTDTMVDAVVSMEKVACCDLVSV